MQILRGSKRVLRPCFSRECLPSAGSRCGGNCVKCARECRGDPVDRVKVVSKKSEWNRDLCRLRRYLEGGFLDGGGTYERRYFPKGEHNALRCAIQAHRAEQYALRSCADILFDRCGASVLVCNRADLFAPESCGVCCACCGADLDSACVLLFEEEKIAGRNQDCFLCA